MKTKLSDEYDFYLEPDGCNVIAVYGEMFWRGSKQMRECIGAVYYGPNSQCCGTAASVGYLCECKKITEAEARNIHPNLFSHLDVEGD